MTISSTNQILLSLNYQQSILQLVGEYALGINKVFGQLLVEQLDEIGLNLTSAAKPQATNTKHNTEHSSCVLHLVDYHFIAQVNHFQPQLVNRRRAGANAFRQIACAGGRGGGGGSRFYDYYTKKC